MLRRARFASLLSAAATLSLALWLTGCAANFNPSVNEPAAASLGAIQGKVFGGQQPVSGARVYVYAAGTSAYGTASTSLLNSVTTGSFPTTKDSSNNYYVTTDANGNFALAGEYTCTAGQQVYLLVTGGNSGNGTNSAIGLMSVLGQCPSSGGSLATLVPNVIVNEVSTVAAAFAFAGYAVDPTHVGDDEAVYNGASTTNGTTQAQAKAGMAAAFANAFNLNAVNSGYGALSATPSGGIVPEAEINSLADALAACVNTTSTTPAACSTLFGAAPKDGNTANLAAGNIPTDTASAAINIAHHPAAAPGTIFSLVNATGPFQPTLTKAPSDWTIGIQYGKTTFSAPVSIAVDASGNVWVADNDYIREVSPAGYISSYTSYLYYFNLTQLQKLIVTPGGAIAMTSANSSEGLTYQNSSFNTFQGQTSGIYAYSLITMLAAATGTTGSNVLYYGGPNYASAGSPECSSGGNAMAVDTSGNLWIAGSTLYEWSSNCNSELSPQNGWSLSGPATAVAIDSANHVWASIQSPASLVEYSSSGSLLATYSGGGLDLPSDINIDGVGTVWVANYDTTATTHGVTAYSNAGAALSPAAGLGSASILGPANSIATDPSGNVWVSVYPNYSAAGNTGPALVELVGAGAPVITPTGAAEYTRVIASRP